MAQTLTEIRWLLEAAGVSPRHHHGQHFLIDGNLMRKLVRVAAVGPADVVLEVGAGTGSLTELLLECGARVIAVEIDPALQRILRERLEGKPGFTLIAGDVLAGKHHLNPQVLAQLAAQTPGPGGARKLVANLPYQVATPLLLELLYATPRVTLLACTIQKEVADRLTAAPKTKDYGLVSVVAQSLAEIEHVATLAPSVFWPRPKVDSAMLLLHRRSDEQVHAAIDDLPGFVDFVRRAFQQRRKMLRRQARNWNELAAAGVFDRAGVSRDWRPEELSVAQWQALFRAVRRAAAR